MQKYLVCHRPIPCQQADVIERDDIVHAATAYVARHFGADAEPHIIYVQEGIEIPAVVHCLEVRVHPIGVASTRTLGPRGER